MDRYLMLLIWCVILITGISAYFPVIYIRKTNKLLKMLEQIEANTHKAEAPPSQP